MFSTVVVVLFLTHTVFFMAASAGIFGFRSIAGASLAGIRKQSSLVRIFERIRSNGRDGVCRYDEQRRPGHHDGRTGDERFFLIAHTTKG